MLQFDNNPIADQFRRLRVLACGTLIAFAYGCGGGGSGSSGTTAASAETTASAETAASTEASTPEDTTSEDAARLAALESGAIPGTATTVQVPADEPPVMVELPADESEIREAAPLNSVQTIIDDMVRPNDLRIAGVSNYLGWASGAVVTMGGSPRGDATPSYWQPRNRAYKSGNPWRLILPWFVIFDGVGNSASNTYVQIRAMKLYVKSRSTGRWSMLAASAGFGGYMYPKHMQGTSFVAARVLHAADGSATIQPGAGGMAFHGWCCGLRGLPNPTDVGAVHVTMQARVVPNPYNRADDRSRARYLLHVGADYYPSAAEINVNMFTPSPYNPGVGVSRAKLLTANWQPVSMTTLTIPRKDAPSLTLSADQLRAAPPPME